MKRIITKSRGFTLVEIMVVVVILGMILTMALPFFKNIRMSSQNARLKNDIRQFSDAIDTYAIDKGRYPDDSAPGVVPVGMEGYMPAGFTSKPPIGGSYVWSNSGTLAAVGVDSYTADSEQIEKFEKNFDDSNTGTGQFRIESGAYLYVVQETP